MYWNLVKITANISASKRNVYQKMGATQAP